jgi:DNA-binding transcriptional LysR family regulator
MDRWQLYQAFVRTADTGSLSKAAQDLHLTQPAVSKRLHRLEKDMGVILLQRSSRGVRLTDAGIKFLEVVRRVMLELEETEATLASDRTGVSGTLRLSFPVALGETWLTKIAIKFHEQNPHTRIELNLTDRVVNLVEEAIDVTVRIGIITNQSVAARPLGRFRRCLVASPDYLRKNGTPTHFESLIKHPFFSTMDIGAEETFTLPNGKIKRFLPEHRFKLANSRAIVTAVLERAGIARVNLWAADEHIKRGELVLLLPEFEAPGNLVSAVFLPSRYVPERVRQFVSFLVKEIPLIPGWVPPNNAE